LEPLLGGQNNNFDEYNETKPEFDEIQAEKAQGIIIRSRGSYVENNEKCTKYFLSLEMRNYKTQSTLKH